MRRWYYVFPIHRRLESLPISSLRMYGRTCVYACGVSTVEYVDYVRPSCTPRVCACGAECGLCASNLYPIKKKQRN